MHSHSRITKIILLISFGLLSYPIQPFLLNLYITNNYFLWYPAQTTLQSQPIHLQKRHFGNPQPKWYWDNLEKGIEFDYSTREYRILTFPELMKQIHHAGPIGPPVPANEVEDVTPSYSEFIIIMGLNTDYSLWEAWIRTQTDTYHYCRSRDCFNKEEAFLTAGRLGYRKVILENLS